MLPEGSPAPAGYTFVVHYELKPLPNGGTSKDGKSKDGKSKDNKKLGVDVYIRN
jgi:hypothetical protein